MSFVHVLGGNTLVTIAQGLQFLLLARVLGPDEFGLIAATGGVTALLMPFSGAGSANVMVMRGARDQALLPLYFGNSLAVMLGTAALLIAASTAVVGALLDHQVSTSLMLLFGLSELLAAKTVDICWHVFLARDEVPRTSRMQAFHSGVRFLSAALFAVIATDKTAGHWVWWALAGNAAVALILLRNTMRVVGPLRFNFKLVREEFGNGLSFAVGFSASSFYTDADKIFLARYAGSAIVGEYTMAFRIVQIILTPIRALFFSLQAKMYRAGEAGLEGAIRVTKSVLLPLLAGALALGIAFYLAAPLLTLVAGERYRGSVGILRAQWLLPAVLALQSMLGATLSTSGFHRAAATAQIVCALFICALCMVLIPKMGWTGAVISSYASQGALIVMLLWSIYRRRDPPAVRAAARAAREQAEPKKSEAAR